jgi:hypothetical protein
MKLAIATPIKNIEIMKILVYQGNPIDSTTYWQIINPKILPQFVFVAQNPSNPD